ncbi:MAG: oxidoreductase [Alphaproteobacteria bacterium]|nr:oxidoreductase [Alphaproteobacteria bacterium]
MQGKVALVVGGTRGIGAAIARRLAAEGATLALIHLGRTAEAGRLAAELEAGGAQLLLLKADVGDPSALSGAIDAAIARFGPVDILVNNAGIAVTGPLEDYRLEDFDRSFAVNVRAPFLAAQKVAAAMREGGRIITIGSVVADHMPGPGGTLYAASKSALGGLTRGLARDLGDRRITVNLVQPGPTDTERNPADGPNAADNRMPLAIQRHGKAEEIASLVAWLASDAAGFVTGATYDIDGGWCA